MEKYTWLADLGNGTYQNPILYTDYSDPDAIRVGEDYYMVASSFNNAPAIPVLHSKDLVNWKIINYVLDAIPEQRYEKPIHGCGVWAPSIRYYEGTYYVCFPMPDEGIYMSTAKDPSGIWSKPINIRPGSGWIDPCPFWDNDGKAYLVAGVAKSRIGYKSVLHMVRMKPDGTGVFGEEVKIFDGNFNDQETIEGPKMYKRNGYYYIFAPAGGVKTGWQTVLRSRHIWGPYEYKVVMRQGETLVNGPHQGAWVDTVTGEDWFLHFQDVYAAGRITHLQPMTWREDWPIIGNEKLGADYGEPVSVYQKPNVGKTYEITAPATSDEFDQETLGLQWQWNANYKKEWYKINREHKTLELRAVPCNGVEAVSELPNLLLQKWPAPEFICDMKMNVRNLQKGDYAGMVSMGVTFGGLLVQKNSKGQLLTSVYGHQEFNGQEVTAIQDAEQMTVWDQDEIYFRYEVKQTDEKMDAETEHAPQEEITMYYSQDGIHYQKALAIHAQAGRWVGVKLGMVCATEKDSYHGYVEVEYVRYQSLNS